MQRVISLGLHGMTVKASHDCDKAPAIFSTLRNLGVEALKIALAAGTVIAKLYCR
jgi:hypothetical protein